MNMSGYFSYSNIFTCMNVKLRWYFSYSNIFRHINVQIRWLFIQSFKSVKVSRYLT